MAQKFMVRNLDVERFVIPLLVECCVFGRQKRYNLICRLGS